MTSSKPVARMGDDRTDNRAIPSTDTPRRPPWWIFLLAGAIGITLALLLGIVFRDWIPGPWRSEDALDNRFPSGALADYVPDDSEAIVALDLRAMLQTPVVRQHLIPSLKLFVPQGEERFRWMSLLGIDPIDDLDYLQISFAPGSGGQPLWLARGRLDRSRFQIGPDKLQKKSAEHFRVLEYVDRKMNSTATIAPVGDTLLASDSPARVIAALSHASDPRPAAVRDATLRELLAKVDRRQSIWFAASLHKLGSVGPIDNFWLKTVLRPLFAHAESVYGGITCGDDVRGELHFHTATEESAIKLEADLKSVCELAQTAPRLMRLQKELVPLIRLLGTGQTSREGRTVSLRCLLTGDRLAE